MVVRTPTSLKGADIKLGYWDVYEAQMSTNDTLPLPEFSTGVNLTTTTVIKKSDYTEVTATAALNVVTLTQAAQTNVEFIIFAAGVKA